MALLLSKKLILSLAFGANTYHKGETKYKSNHILEEKVMETENGRIWSFKIQGDDNLHKIFVELNKNFMLTSFVCDCHSSNLWEGACEHVVCALLHILEEINKEKSFNEIVSKNNIPKNISKNKILDEIEKQIIKNSKEFFDINNLSEQVSIIPKMHIDDESVKLSFGLATNRKYIIKNLREFLEDIFDEQVVKYGKDLQFKHYLSSFDDISKELIQFLTLNIDNTLYSIDSRHIIIDTYNSDYFFHIVKDEIISVVFEDEKSEEKIIYDLQILEDTFPILFNIEVRKTKIILELNNKFFKLINAIKHIFVINETGIYKINKERFTLIQSLLKPFIKDKDTKLTFENADKDMFSKILLPELIKNNIIDSNVSYLLENIEHNTSLYLDMKNKNIITKLTYSENTNVAFYKNLLKTYGFIEKAPDEFILSEEDKIFNFLKYAMDDINKYMKIFVTEQFKRKSVIPDTKDINLEVKIKGNILELDFNNLEFPINEMQNVFKDYNISKKYHRLKNGKFLDLTRNNFLELAGFLDKITLDKKNISTNSIKLPKGNSFYLEDIINETEFINVIKEESFNSLIDDVKNFKSLDFELPYSFDKILRDYQKEGVKWLQTLSYYNFGGILADDMGLGKTLQVIALFSSEKENGNTKPNLVVCPASLIFNWQKEINKFAPSLNAIVITGTAEKRESLLNLVNDYDVAITTYDSLKRDVSIYEDKSFRFLIADEAQYIKNPTTQNSRALKTIASDITFALTGTPIENSLTELWSIFDLILPGYLFTLSKFNNIFAKPILKDEDNKMLNILQKQISPFILRRHKKDVLLELPDKIENNLFAEMETEQKKIYYAYLLKANKELEETDNEGAVKNNQIKILSLITRLRQICCDPSLFIENYKGGSGKLDVCLETIISSIESGHRILLFSQFTSMLELIKNKLEKLQLEYFYLDGSLSSKTRIELTEKFNDGEKDIFLISLKAGGTGLNLTGADVIIHYDPWWNSSIMSQATDRAYRMGQSKTVQVFNIFMKDTIEEKILELQNKKNQLIDSVLISKTGFINKMTENELKDLFSLNQFQ